jgi:tetratricopeptide (TPR) repeat protein
MTSASSPLRTSDEKSKSAAYQARSAYNLAKARKPKEATAKLKQVEGQLPSSAASEEAIEAEEFICLTYAELHNGPLTALHHAGLLRRISLVDGQKGPSDAHMRLLLDCKTKMPLVLFDVTPPRNYGGTKWTAALHSILTNKEVALVKNPLAGTPEMAKAALACTAGKRGETQIAKTLYQALLNRITTNMASSPRRQTAEELFSAWKACAIPARCQDLSYLLVALSRSAGLRAYFVQVDEDCYGDRALHSCAAIFLNDKVVLVDPTYSWFGAPHVKFTLLDDLETAAAHLCVGARLPECEIASKLAPNLPLVRANLFDALAVLGRWSEAKEQASHLSRLDPEGPLTYWACAETSCHDGQLDEAIKLVQKAIQAAPQNDVFRLALGRIYLSQGKLTEAKDAYQEASRRSIDAQSTDEATLMLTQIEAMISYNSGREYQAAGQWDNALSAYDAAIRSKPDFAEAYLGRSMVKQAKGDTTGAVSDRSKALELKPDLSHLLHLQETH